jgi:tRNA dimethylallyltransferase
LLEGLHHIPEIDDSLYKESLLLLDEVGNEKFYQILKTIDPLGASKIDSSNTQRILRFYNVFKQTGRSIIDFYYDPAVSLIAKYQTHTMILEIARDILYKRCNERLKDMINAGAIDEVKNVLDYNDSVISAKKVIGFNEFKSFLEQKIEFDEAINLSQTRTRQYAKRQVTWFKHQIKDCYRVNFDENFANLITNLV